MAAFTAKQIAKTCAYDPADDMGQIGDRIPDQDSLIDLSADIDDCDQQEGERNLSVFKSCKGGKKDHGKYNTAGTKKGSTRKEQKVDQSGDKGGGEEHDQDLSGTVFFFQQRSHQKQDRHISEEVIPAGMSEYMTDKTDVGKRTCKACTIDTEEQRIGTSKGQLIQNQCSKTGKNIGEDHRRIKGYF